MRFVRPPSLCTRHISLAAPAAPQGTLLLNNIHKAPQAALPMLRATVERASRESG